VALCVLSLACGERARVEAPDRHAPAPAGWPRTLALPDGSQLTLPRPPRRVVPGSAGSLDMLAALIPAERIAAIPAGSERYSALRDPASPYLARPRFAAYQAEPLLLRDPDLVLVHSWQSADTTRRLTQAGVPVLRLADANDWPTIAAQLELLGALLGAESRAAQVLAEHVARVQALAATWAGRPRPTALCYSNGGAGGSVAGADTTNDEILRLAGLVNLAAERGRVGHGSLTFEELLVLDPDVLVVGSSEEGADMTGGTAAVLAGTAALSGLSALRHGHVVTLPSWLYTTTGQHVVDAAEQLAAAVEPWRDALGARR